MSTAVSVPTPRLPSISEIEKIMRENLPGMTVYSPSPEWIPLLVFGLNHIYAVPDLNGAVEPHPITGVPVVCNGITVLRGRFLDQKDSSGKKIEGQDAPSMVRFVIHPDNYGQMGLVWLPGRSTEEDERMKAASRAVFMSYQLTRDQAAVERRAEFKTNWLKHHKEEPCPPPTRAEMDAMDRLQIRKRVAAYKYECDVTECPGYAVNDWEKFVAHMKAAHNVTPKRSTYEGEVRGISDVVRPVSEEVEVQLPRTAIQAAAEAMQAQAVEPEDEPEAAPDEPRPREPKEKKRR